MADRCRAFGPDRPIIVVRQAKQSAVERTFFQSTATHWNESHKTTYSVFDLDFLACGLAERAQIRIHSAGWADDEARHEAENGIVDLGVLGDADRSAAG
jgi:hypothetical protein